MALVIHTYYVENQTLIVRLPVKASSGPMANRISSACWCIPGQAPRHPTYELEALVALQRKSIHQVAGLVRAVGQRPAHTGLAEQRHCRKGTRARAAGGALLQPMHLLLSLGSIYPREIRNRLNKSFLHCSTLRVPLRHLHKNTLGDAV